MSAIWKVETIPVLEDNFVFVIHNQKQAIVIDPGEAEPVLEYLESHNLVCEKILITHHHDDHIDGIQAIKERHACKVYAPALNQSEVPQADQYLHDKEGLVFHGLEIHTFAVPGHTIGHLMFWIPAKKWLFSGDVVFALGCGRLFEGTAEQMFASIEKIKALPDETLIFCTHDYFASNKKFADSLKINLSEYDNIHPLLLAQEKDFNPFFKCKTSQEFKELRLKRNNF